jgi:translocation and assembly module TamB
MRRVLRILLRGIAVLAGLLVILIVLVQFPPVQTYIADKAVGYISERMETRIELDRIALSIRGSVVAKGFYVEDLSGDTLVYIGHLDVRFGTIALLRGNIDIRSLSVDDVRAYIYRTAIDSAFNFDFFLAQGEDEDITVEQPASAPGEYGEPTELKIGNIRLERIYAVYRDEIDKINATLSLGFLHIDFDEINPGVQRYSIGDLIIDDVDASVDIQKLSGEVKTDADPGPLPQLELGGIVLSNINLRYTDGPEGEKIGFGLDSLHITANRIDLPAGIIDLSSVYTAGVSLVYHYRGEVSNQSVDISEQTVSESPASGTEQKEWMLSLSSLVVSDSEIQVRDLNRDDHTSGLDVANISLVGITVDAEHIRLSRNDVRARLNGMTFQEQSGLILSNLTGGISIDDAQAEISDMILKTGASELAVDISVEYPSIADIGTDPHAVRIKRLSVISDLDVEEIQGILPELSFVAEAERTDYSRIKTAIDLSGTLADLIIDRIHIETGYGTVFKAHGNITGLPEPDSIRVDVRVDELSTVAGDLEDILPPEAIPENIRFPEFILLTADVSGSRQEFEGSIFLSSSYGDADVQFAIIIPGDGFTSYKGVLDIRDFDFGSLLSREEQFGRLTAHASLAGLGIDIDSMITTLGIRIDSAELLGHQYRNIHIDGNTDRGEGAGRITIDDDFIKLSADATMQTVGYVPHYRLSFVIDEIVLNELNLADGEFYLHGRITADIAGTAVDSLKGYIRFDDFLVIDNEERYTIDTLLISVYTDDTEQEIAIASGFLNGSYRGNIGIESLPDELTRHINSYFPIHTYNGERDTTPRHFEFHLTLTDPGAIPAFLVPELERISPFTLTGRYDSEESKIDVSMEIPEIVYAGLSMHMVRLVLESDPQHLQTTLTLEKIESKTITIFYPAFSASFADSIVTPRLRLGNAENEDVFVIGFDAVSVDTGYFITIDPTDLLLNGERWRPSEDHLIFFGEAALHIDSLRLEKGERYIEATTSLDSEEEAELHISFEYFPIDALTGNIRNPLDQLRADIRGSFRMAGVVDKPRLLVDLAFERIYMGSDTVGNLHIWARSESPDEYIIDARITRNGDYAGVEGSIVTGDDATVLNLTVGLDRYNLASIEPFTFGTLKNLSGYLTGGMTVQGTTGEPLINGSLRFSEVNFDVTPLNTSFNLRNESIAFDNAGIQFPSFTLRDAEGNTAVINGLIGREAGDAVRFNLDLRSTDFTLMNTTREHNDLVYGRIVLNSDVRIRGLSDNPAIDGNIGLRRGTAVTVVLPETDLELVEREGIVTFAEIDAVDDLSRTVETESDTLRIAVRGLNVTVNVQVDPQTELTVIVDPRAGDQVVIHGGGDLSFGIDPSGFMSLAGRYEINDGSYQLSFYDVARRGFDIRPGSSIVWSGDPLDAEIDISGIYSVRTSPLELVGDQVSEQTRQQYRRPLTFQVYLNMKGKLLEPEINFTLDMPPDQRGAFGGVIYRRVQQLNEQETELNKQVFSLLILNRFIAENPFDISEGGGLSARARSSASRIMTQQLNALSGKYLRGLVISFEIESYEDYTEDGTIGRTELQLQVSQRFLDDRIIVELGGNVDLEGERKKQIELMDIAGDIAVEYLITQDGRYRLRGFRETEYHGLVDGEITTTGLSLVMTRDFNTFVELFRKPRVLEPVD